MVKRLLLLTTLLFGIGAGSAFPVSSPAPPLLRLRNATFDPAAPAARSLSVTHPTRYFLVQFNGPVRQDWKRSLEASGAKVFDYVPDNAYVCNIPVEASGVGQLPFVRAVTPYLPGYKIDPALSKRRGILTAVVSLFPDANAEAFVAAARSYGVQAKRVGRATQVTGDAEAVRSLANEEGVRWIEPRPGVKLHNDKSRVILGVNRVWQDIGLYGAGQVLGYLDTGLDTGNPKRISEDFAGRIVDGMGINTENDWADHFGHGTHVAGIMVGAGVLSGSIPEDRKYVRSFAGVAPEAKLVVQEIDVNQGDGTSEVFDENTDLIPLLQWAYDKGVRIHNNSWGDDGVDAGAYTLHASQLDQFIWDHPDFTLFFAAGNEGVDSPEQAQVAEDAAACDENDFDCLLSLYEEMESLQESQDGMVDPGSISPPSTAKNVVTVGASEGDRPPGAGWGGYSDLTYMNALFMQDPIANDYFSDNIEGMAAFSSRGPTLDGRTKPDLVAPGTDILSNKSTISNDAVYWSVYNANYAYAGGTSMSSPYAAGSAALVREWLQEKKNVAAPSAALLKALMVNTAHDMAPGQYEENEEIPARPNSVEGWGRVDLEKLLETDRKILFTDDGGLKTEEKKQVVYHVQEGQPLSVTLAWSDHSATPAAEAALVNDLDLTVTDPDGKKWPGNGEADHLNNVEGVDIAAPKTGDYTVEINAVNVPQGREPEGRQPYALVVTGAVTVDVGAPQPGDVNMDGSVDTADVVLMLRSIVGLETLTAEQTVLADVSPTDKADGLVDVNDALVVLKRIVGILT